MTERDMDDFYQAIRLLCENDVDEKKEFLRKLMSSDSGGVRSAAASVLGELGDIGFLAEHLKTETNKIVRAGIKARLRVAMGIEPTVITEDEVEAAIDGFISHWAIESMCPAGTFSQMETLKENSPGAFRRAIKRALTAASNDRSVKPEEL